MATPTKEKLYLKEVATAFKLKLQGIKVCLFDIDGILTNGGISWEGEELGFNRITHALDGFGMKFLMDSGIKVGVISGGDSLSVRKRFIENLKLDYVFLGNENKIPAFEKILQDGFLEEEILFMGDEFIDLPLLKRSGFSATVPNSSLEIQLAVDYITQRESGDGAVREVIDILRIVKNLVPEMGRN